MMRFLRFFCLAALGMTAASGSAVAQMMPYGDGMPRRGSVTYDMTLTRMWSPVSIRMIGKITAHETGMRQNHCMQPSYAPTMACQTTINGEPSRPYMVPPPVGGFGGPGRPPFPPGAGPMPYGPGGPGGGPWSYPGGRQIPRWGGQQLPGFVPPPFGFPGGATGPEFEMSGKWEWQGWRIHGTFRYSQATW